MMRIELTALTAGLRRQVFFGATVRPGLLVVVLLTAPLLVHNIARQGSAHSDDIGVH